jgi:hypothetical protein
MDSKYIVIQVFVLLVSSLAALAQADEAKKYFTAAFATPGGKWVATLGLNKVQFIGDHSLDAANVDVIFKKAE